MTVTVTKHKHKISFFVVSQLYLTFTSLECNQTDIFYSSQSHNQEPINCDRVKYPTPKHISLVLFELIICRDCWVLQNWEWFWKAVLSYQEIYPIDTKCNSSFLLGTPYFLSRWDLPGGGKSLGPDTWPRERWRELFPGLPGRLHLHLMMTLLTVHPGTHSLQKSSPFLLSALCGSPMYPILYFCLGNVILYRIFSMFILGGGY